MYDEYQNLVCWLHPGADQGFLEWKLINVKEGVRFADFISIF